jgi:hypothetical protein
MEVMHIRLTEDAFLKFCKQVLGEDGIERTNRAWVQKNGYDPSMRSFLDMRYHLAFTALTAAELDVEYLHSDGKAVTFIMPDCSAVLFKLKYL